MKESKADVVLHPVRMRIIQTLVNKRQLTVQQIGEKLSDVPQASLYRHLKKLVDGDIVEVVEERQVRGTIEKVYGLPEQAASLSEEELKSAGPEEHMSFFMKFIATVLDDFERYVNQEEFDFIKDGTGYRQISFYADDDEYRKLLETINGELMKLIGNEEEGRRKRTLTTIVTAEKNKEQED